MKSKEDFQEIREMILCEVEKDYFQSNQDIFLNKNVAVKAARVEGEDFEKDETHKALLKNYYEARRELRDYEFDKRHNKK